MISALLWLFNTVVVLYIVVIIAMMLMTWVTAFSADNRRNPILARVSRSFYAITNPAIYPVRRYVPSLGGVDLSPIIVVLLLEFARRLVNSAATGSFTRAPPVGPNRPRRTRLMLSFWCAIAP
jgi:YggT family protein